MAEAAFASAGISKKEGHHDQTTVVIEFSKTTMGFEQMNSCSRSYGALALHAHMRVCLRDAGMQSKAKAWL